MTHPHPHPSYIDALRAFERESDARLDASLPMIARLDMVSSRGWRQHHDRLRDSTRADAPATDIEEFYGVMDRTTLSLAEELKATFVYTCNDEVTLLFESDGLTALPHEGRVQKLASLLASVACIAFNAEARKVYRKLKYGTFDARVYNVPTQEIAAQVIFWRQQEASRNSVQAYFQERFPDVSIQGLATRDQKTKLSDAGTPWGELPVRQRYGAAFRREFLAFPGEETSHVAYTPVHLPLHRQGNYLPVLFSGTRRTT